MAHRHLRESILRDMWLNRFFDRSELTTTDHRAVTVVDPGHTNADAGPDVRDAVIRIGGQTFRGDVEFHTDSALWYSHGHHVDEHYNGTILHLVFRDTSDSPAVTQSGRPVPEAVVAPDETPPPDHFPLPCYDFPGAVAAPAIEEWLTHLSRIRLERKVLHAAERLDQLFLEEDRSQEAAWDQLLYEGIMEAAGFEKNRRPFLALARGVRLSTLRQHGMGDPYGVMALLFGAGGLLPDPGSIADPQSSAYVEPLAARWAQLRPQYRGPHLHPGEWIFFRLRPSNFPTSRLAAVSFLLPRLFGRHSVADLASELGAGDSNELRKKVDLLFTAPSDPFWRRHFRFGQRSPRAVTTPGKARRGDIAANALLPVMILYGRLRNLPSLVERSLHLYSSMPPLQKSRILRRLEAELPGGVRLNSVGHQQGALHLARVYCAEGRCGECAIGRTIGLASIPDNLLNESPKQGGVDYRGRGSD